MRTVGCWRSSGSDVALAHEPVLLAEVLELLRPTDEGFYVDGTVGLGGHAEAVMQRSAPSGRLLGVDRDAETLALAGERLAPYGERVELVHHDFRRLPELLAERRAPDGILLDLGINSVQLDTPERGFAFRSDGPLDMRMDRSQEPPAAELVNRLSERDLADLIFRFGEERASRRIARAICRARPIHTTAELATLVRRALPRRTRIDQATRTFQALRIAVNRELEGIDESLEALASHLAPRGRLAVIAFHSLEDRIVKHSFRDLKRRGFKLLTAKPIRPSEAERGRNRRSRSARLRALEREAA